MQVSEEADGGEGGSQDIRDCRSGLRWIGAGWAWVYLLSVVRGTERKNGERSWTIAETMKVEGRRVEEG